MFNFSEEDKEIVARLSVPGGWDHEDSRSLRRRLKAYLLTTTTNCCCYCRGSMHGWHSWTIDVEHVLPKGKKRFPQFTFELMNLSVSCKRCNMQIKRADTKFFIGRHDDPQPFQSELYRFVHPNLDNIDDHLQIVSHQHGIQIMVAYRVLNDSPKGSYAFKYFKLDELVTNNFDSAQGLVEAHPSESMPVDYSDELLELTERAEA